DLKSAVAPLVLLAAVQVGCAIQAAPGRAPESASPEIRPDARTARDLDLGRAALGLGDLATATVRLREALRAQPDLPEARESLARALHRQGDLVGRGEELRELLSHLRDAGRRRYFVDTLLVGKQD